MKVIESDDNFNSDNGKDDDEICEAKDEVVKDPLDQYEERVQHERMVSHFFSSTYFPLISALSHCKNTFIKEKIHIHKTYRQCTCQVKSRTR
jgi:hypothetical protein